MEMTELIVVCLTSATVSIFSVSVGCTSLITVPILISYGMISKNAVSTNMFALIFLSLIGIIGFRKEIKSIKFSRIDVLISITIWGSLIGAHLLLMIDEGLLRQVIAIIMVIGAGLFILNNNISISENYRKRSNAKFILGIPLIFVLSIYSGFFSGGYVMLSSFVFIIYLGFTFLQAAYITKVMNLISSLIACIFFFDHGLIDFSVGIPLSISMSAGAFIGTQLAIRKGNLWIRKLFILAILILSVNLLFLK